jgi:hypothetical protein
MLGFNAQFGKCCTAFIPNPNRISDQSTDPRYSVQKNHFAHFGMTPRSVMLRFIISLLFIGAANISLISWFSLTDSQISLSSFWPRYIVQPKKKTWLS